MKRSLTAQIDAVSAAKARVPKGRTQDYEQASLEAAIATLRWVQANEASIRAWLAERGGTG